MGHTRVVAHHVATARRLTGLVKRRPARRVSAATLVAGLWLATALIPLAEAQTFTVLYSFAGYPTDGSSPGAGLLMDASGNLYGTTLYGGNDDTCQGDSGIGCGTVFKLDTNGAETVLYHFSGTDGANPISIPIMDANGDLYGTTAAGGHLQDCANFNYAGCGVVFKLSGTKETVLHRFTAGADGAQPEAGVIMDASGALYGTAYEDGPIGAGVVFKLVGTKETVLHAFTAGKDGGFPTAGLLMDANGVLYGTATDGGDSNCEYPYGCGVVFKLAGKKETVLHAFRGSPDGQEPEAALLMDPSGNLYSTTWVGGAPYNAGTVFELTAGGKEQILHRFRVNYHKQHQHDGLRPATGVVLDAQGNLYGTTYEGGDKGVGVVYEITARGEEKILHSFCSGDCSDGSQPNDLIIDAEGNLYGTTSAGGANNDGVIFMITP